MTGIKAEFEPVIGGPIKIPLLEPFPIDPVNRIEIPGEDINSQVIVLLAKPI
jgi:hypothetical protein